MYFFIFKLFFLNVKKLIYHTVRNIELRYEKNVLNSVSYIVFFSFTFNFCLLVSLSFRNDATKKKRLVHTASF